MFFRLFLILFSATSLAAQIRWTCDAKDGKFIMTPCATCKKLFCWDGKIFSEEEGYTPPPAYVLSYWEEVHRRSQQIRADIDRKGKELRERFEKGQQETQRLNQERAQARSQGYPQRGIPKSVIVVPPGPAESAPSPVPASRAKVSEVQMGMDRATVEGILGKPYSAMSIPGDDGLVEVLNYTLDDHGTARVRIESGKVASVTMSQ